MNSNRLVLNTLVKQSEHNSGIAQDKLVTELLDSGVSNIELRREYGNSTISEFDRLSKFRMKSVSIISIRSQTIYLLTNT